MSKISGMSYREKLMFFCKARVGAERFSLAPETGFAERWRLKLSGLLVRPHGMPEDGYLTRMEALAGARLFRQHCRDTAAAETAPQNPVCGGEG